MVFHQILNPAHHVALTAILALIPFAVLLALLAGFRITAWLSVIVGSIVTLAMAIGIWKMPLGTGLHAYFLGSLTGFWDIDWITLWGVVIFNTLTLTGIFDTFKTWLMSQATADIRVQTILLAWSLGALLEGLVGFGYPWAVMAPILIGFGIVELDAIRVAAIANNAPVSYGALGVPIIALAAVTGLPLLSLSASVGKIVALLALLPPWLLNLFSHREKRLTGWLASGCGGIAILYFGTISRIAVGGTLFARCYGIAGFLWRVAAVLARMASASHFRVWRRRTGRSGGSGSRFASAQCQRGMARLDAFYCLDCCGGVVDRAVVALAEN